MKKNTKSEFTNSVIKRILKGNINLIVFVIFLITTTFNSCYKVDDLINTDSSTFEKMQDSTLVTEPIILPEMTIIDSFLRVPASVPGTSLVSVPAINVYQPSPTTPVYYNSVTYYGGPFQSCTYSISGNNITFKVKRTDGNLFPVGSVIRIKLNNAGGQIVASKTLTSSASNCTLNVQDLNTWNINGGTGTNPNNSKQYVATWYNSQSGYNFYTLPIRIVAVPTGWGNNIGSFGVSVFSNGWGGFSGTDYLRDPSCNNSQTYQCVHYIQKYYQVVKNINIGNNNASHYWTNYTSHNLTQRIYNGSGIPQMGDIICFQRPNTSDYHVAIVKGVVGGNKIRVYQENWGQTNNNGNYCYAYMDLPFTQSGNNYNISPFSSWIVLGWLRD